jgi:hypothetical protein
VNQSEGGNASATLRERCVSRKKAIAKDRGYLRQYSDFILTLACL